MKKVTRKKRQDRESSKEDWKNNVENKKNQENRKRERKRRCEALNIGDNNIIEINGSVGPDVELTSGCVVGSMCSLKTKEVLVPNSVVYGPDCKRRVNVERPAGPGRPFIALKHKHVSSTST
uniref:Dynactin subunit 6 n=1 Tax=Romanomermis culicivorax TaxID=13658 RepID=A0A915I329_ROMCU